MSASKLVQNLNKFRLITFDVNDTLLKISIPPHVQYSKTACEFGYNVDKETIQKLFRLKFKEMSKIHPNFGRKTNLNWKDWWRQLIYKIFLSTEQQIPKVELEKIANELINVYRTDKCWTKTNGVDQLLKKIKDNNKIIGLISNTDPSLHNLINVMKLPKFNFVLPSYEAGSMKPSAQIFEKALKLSGNSQIKSNESLHIGNSFELDYLGAINAGWSSLLICDKHDIKNIPIDQINSNHIFENLDNLLQALENDDIKL